MTATRIDDRQCGARLDFAGPAPALAARGGDHGHPDWPGIGGVPHGVPGDDARAGRAARRGSDRRPRPARRRCHRHGRGPGQRGTSSPGFAGESPFHACHRPGGPGVPALPAGVPPGRSRRVPQQRPHPAPRLFVLAGQGLRVRAQARGKFDAAGAGPGRRHLGWLQHPRRDDHLPVRDRCALGRADARFRPGAPAGLARRAFLGAGLASSPAAGPDGAPAGVWVQGRAARSR